MIKHTTPAMSQNNCFFQILPQMAIPFQTKIFYYPENHSKKKS